MFFSIKDAIKKFGIFPGFIYLLSQIIHRISSKSELFYYELMAQPVTNEPLLGPRYQDWLRPREIKQGDAILAEMPLTAATLAHRFVLPTVCLGGFRNDQLLGYMWLCLGAYEEDEVRCAFIPDPNQGVWDFDFYIVPKHRLGPTFLGLWDGAYAFLRQRGYRYSFSRVSRFNLASRRAHDRLDWKKIGSAIFLKLGQCQLMAATVPPYVHVSVSARTRPVIRVRSGPARP